MSSSDISFARFCTNKWDRFFVTLFSKKFGKLVRRVNDIEEATRCAKDWFVRGDAIECVILATNLEVNLPPSPKEKWAEFEATLRQTDDDDVYSMKTWSDEDYQYFRIVRA